MNKEELIKELSLHRNTYSNDHGFGSGVKAGLKLAIMKIGKLDELDELKKVVVPKFVADEFDYDKNYYWEVNESKDIPHILKCAFGNEGKPSEFLDWVRDNPEDYLMAVRNGCEVKEEPLYYALIKGHELLADEDAWYCNYWNLSISDGRVFPSDKSSADGSFSAEMTKSEWNEIGINDSNADFIKVKEE